MAARPGLLLAIVIGAALVTWWACQPGHRHVAGYFGARPRPAATGRRKAWSRNAFNPDVYLVAERYEVDRLGQKRLSAILQRPAFRLCVSCDHDDRDVRS